MARILFVTTRLLLVTSLLVCVAGQAPAQQHQHGQSPYAGLEGREIKALSEEQLQQLRNGEGMTLALPAELNHYPGPRHVLDLAQELSLTAEQEDRVRGIEQAMRARAVALGTAIIEKERQLDLAFARRTITEGGLRELVGEIARLQADLRSTHLSAHLEVRLILTERQVARYGELRGYRPAPAPRSPTPE